MFDGLYGVVVARREGLTMRQISWALLWGVDLLSYIKAGQIATYSQIRVAVKRGIDLRDYTRALGAGASPEQVIEAHDKHADLFEYISALRVGSSPEQVIEAHDKSIDLYEYFFAIVAGKTHEEAVGALGLEVVCRPPHAGSFDADGASERQRSLTPS